MGFTSESKIYVGDLGGYTQYDTALNDAILKQVGLEFEGDTYVVLMGVGRLGEGGFTLYGCKTGFYDLDTEVFDITAQVERNKAAHAQAEYVAAKRANRAVNVERVMGKDVQGCTAEAGKVHLAGNGTARWAELDK